MISVCHGVVSRRDLSGGRHKIDMKALAENFPRTIHRRRGPQQALAAWWVLHERNLADVRVFSESASGSVE